VDHIQMLPRSSTALALLLVILGMFWLGDACCDDLLDGAPSGAAEYLCCNVNSTDKQHAETVVYRQGTEPGTNAVVRAIGEFALDATARTRLRPQQHTVRAPPSISA
jgi:hypothetical protein